LRDLIQSYPEIAAVLVLVVGAGLGKLAQVLVRRVLSLSDRLVSRYGTRDRQLVSPVFQQGFSLLVFAAVLVLAAVVAVRLLDIAELTAWLDAVLAYVPRFLIGLFIIGVGNVVGALLRNLTAGVMTGGDGNALLPRLVHVGVVAIAVITGLQQMGIDISFVTQLALIVLAALLGALSLAFALGARQHVANLMAQSELSRYATGDRLRIDGDEGIIVEIYRTGLTLTTDEGIVSIPASRLANGRVVQVSQKPEGE
jgi:small-conductance mechanosensitive channel